MVRKPFWTTGNHQVHLSIWSVSMRIRIPIQIRIQDSQINADPDPQHYVKWTFIRGELSRNWDLGDSQLSKAWSKPWIRLWPWRIFPCVWSISRCESCSRRGQWRGGRTARRRGASPPARRVPGHTPPPALRCTAWYKTTHNYSSNRILLPTGTVPWYLDFLAKIVQFCAQKPTTCHTRLSF